MNNNNNNNSKRNNNSCINSSSDSSTFFYILWHNKFIRSKIIKYLRLLNFKNLIKKYFCSYYDFIESNDKYDYSSIVIKGRNDNDKEFISFLNQLPSTVISLEFEDSGYLNINIKDLVLPVTLKEITNLDKIFIGTSQFSTIEEENIEFNKYSTIFNHLVKFRLPNNIKIQNSLPSFKSLTWLDLGDNFAKRLEANYLPGTLLHLRLGKAYHHQIQRNVLPEKLESLSIAADYPHTVIELPLFLKSLCFEKSSKGISNSILKGLPNSITNIDLSGGFKDLIGSLSNILPLSLKRLKIVSFISNKCFKPNINIMQYLNLTSNYINGYPASLTHLDIACADSFVQSIDTYFPSTLKVLKLRHSNIDFKKGKGFPASLTSIECDSKILSLHFNDPNNIQSLKIHCSYSFFNSSFLTSKFPNVKSIKTYSILQSAEFQFKPTSVPESITNLETITYAGLLNISNYNNNSFKLTNNNIKSLKLDSIQTFLILKQQKQEQEHQTISPFPSCCLLLDLDFNDSYYKTQDPPSLPLNLLPTSLKILVLRGKKSPRILFSSPDQILNSSLEYIYIYDENKSIINHSFYWPIQILTFNEIEDYKTNRFSNSILYRKLKKYINQINK